MGKDIRDFVMNHALFCHHNHHVGSKHFDEGLGEWVEGRSRYGFRSMFGYADSDLEAAAGARPAGDLKDDSFVGSLWPKIRTTGYGRAAALACRELFDLDFCPDNFARITEALRASIAGKSASEVFDYFVREKANTRWIINDGFFFGNDPAAQGGGMYPDYYRFTWRMDQLFSLVNAEPLQQLERSAGVLITNLDRLVEAMNTTITRFRKVAGLAALKIGMAYERDLVVSDPSRHEAERALNRILSRKTFYDQLQQESGAVNAREGRPLGDYIFHRLMERASDEDIPVQIHTGYLAGNWGSLNGTKASHLIPIFDKYRRVRFDIFHASWPWASELGAIAKNYPNVYPDLCWAWAMNPTESERALSEWLDGVPFNKIFGYGADTLLPWCDVGYAMQARVGIARVLEQKIDAGYFLPSTAEEVAEHIMLRNGEDFFGLGGQAG